MSSQLAEHELIQAARRHIEQAGEALPSARFTIHYEGFGTGGTAGVTADGACLFLNRLNLQVSRDAHRYNRPLRAVEVIVESSISFNA